MHYNSIDARVVIGLENKAIRKGDHPWRIGQAVRHPAVESRLAIENILGTVGLNHKGATPVMTMVATVCADVLPLYHMPLTRLGSTGLLSFMTIWSRSFEESRFKPAFNPGRPVFTIRSQNPGNLKLHLPER